MTSKTKIVEWVRTFDWKAVETALAREPGLLTYRDERGRNLLHLCCGVNVNFQDSRGMSALHYMLKKGSDKKHFAMIVRYGAHGDLANAKGETAAALMARKRDPGWKRMCSRLTAAA